MNLTVESVRAVRCHRGEHDAYLAVRFAHPSYLYPQRQPPEAMITLTLCPRCDAADPSAGDLLRYFAGREHDDGQDAAQLPVLLERWLAAVTPPGRVDPAAFAADVAAYERGEYI